MKESCSNRNLSVCLDFEFTISPYPWFKSKRYNQEEEKKGRRAVQYFRRRRRGMAERVYWNRRISRTQGIILRGRGRFLRVTSISRRASFNYARPSEGTFDPHGRPVSNVETPILPVAISRRDIFFNTRLSVARNVRESLQRVSISIAWTSFIRTCYAIHKNYSL